MTKSGQVSLSPFSNSHYTSSIWTPHAFPNTPNYIGHAPLIYPPPSTSFVWNQRCTIHDKIMYWLFWDVLIFEGLLLLLFLRINLFYIQIGSPQLKVYAHYSQSSRNIVTYNVGIWFKTLWFCTHKIIPNVSDRKISSILCSAMFAIIDVKICIKTWSTL